MLSHIRLFATFGLEPARLLCPWDFSGKNTGVEVPQMIGLNIEQAVLTNVCVCVTIT